MMMTFLHAASCALALLVCPLLCWGWWSGWRSLPHAIARLVVCSVERKLNRSNRAGYIRESRGGILVVILLLLASLPPLLSYSIHYSLMMPQWITDGILLSLCLYSPYVFARFRRGLKYSGKGQTEAMRKALHPVFRRDAATADEHTLNRSLIEEGAETFADRVISPLFWFMLTGLFGAFAQQMIHYADAMVGHRSQKYRSFGRAVALMDDVFNYIPARISIVFLALAALFTPKGKFFTALLLPLRQAKKLTSPNSGWPIATVAGALNVALGGPRSLNHTYYDEGWIGKGTAKVERSHIKLALQLSFSAHLLLLTGCLVVANPSFWMR